jgi:(2Fe-2S) ferredoxin
VPGANKNILVGDNVDMKRRGEPRNKRDVAMKEKPLAESGCVLVCGGKSCKKAGSGKLRKALEKAAEDADAKVMVMKTKCLGGCGKGPVVNAWPKGVCFTEATPDDATEILTAAGVTIKKKREKKEKKGKVVKEGGKVKAKKEVKAKAAKAPKAMPPKTKKPAKAKAKAKAKKPDKIAPPKGEAMTPEAHGYAE